MTNIAHFSTLVPRLSVLSAQEAHLRYGIDTGAALRQLAGALVVTDRSVISEILALANLHKLPLWPISGGRNFGYGTALPVRDNVVIVDLSGLKNIRLYPDVAIAVIEPGVTQQDLYVALQEARLPFMVPTTGAGPNGSLIGNALDGGYGLNPVSDHFDALTRIAGYWANGQAFDHPYAEMGCTELASVWKHGLGPSCRGLLYQGNFGLVAEATLQLTRIPEASRLIVMEFSSEDAFHATLPKLCQILPELPGLPGFIFTSPHISPYPHCTV